MGPLSLTRFGTAFSVLFFHCLPDVSAQFKKIVFAKTLDRFNLSAKQPAVKFSGRMGNNDQHKTLRFFKKATFNSVNKLADFRVWSDTPAV